MEEKDLGNGMSIIGFSSAEEMFAYQEQRRVELAEEMKHLAPQKAWITFGSYAIRFVSGSDPLTTLVIFGRVYNEEETKLLEIAAGASTTNGELEAIMNRFRQLHREGYRYGRWFSTICPDGEVGDAHVTTLWPITEADYQHALNNRWECPGYLMTRVLDEIKQADPRKDEDE